MLLKNLASAGKCLLSLAIALLLASCSGEEALMTKNVTQTGTDGKIRWGTAVLKESSPAWNLGTGSQFYSVAAPALHTGYFYGLNQNPPVYFANLTDNSVCNSPQALPRSSANLFVNASFVQGDKPGRETVPIEIEPPSTTETEPQPEAPPAESPPAPPSPAESLPGVKPEPVPSAPPPISVPQEKLPGYQGFMALSQLTNVKSLSFKSTNAVLFGTRQSNCYSGLLVFRQGEYYGVIEPVEIDSGWNLKINWWVGRKGVTDFSKAIANPSRR